MKKQLVTSVSGLLLTSMALAGDPVAGGITLSCAANVDGVDYPANTTFYAESYPTQFVIKPVLSSGTHIFYGTYSGTKVYPDYTGTTFVLMPPPTIDEVATFGITTYTEANGNVIWADANTDVPDDEQNGTAKKPFRVLQDAVDAQLAKNKSNIMILVKKGDYNEGGTAKTSGSLGILAARVNMKESKTAFIIRAVEGPAVTTIYGAKASGTTEPYVGWGEDGMRCVQMYSGGALQGFTLRDGSGADQTASVSNYKSGGSVIGSGSSSSTILDCVITNGCSNNGAVNAVTAIRCLFTGNEGRQGVVNSAPCYSCVFYNNKLVDASTGMYHNGGSDNNTTFAGNLKVAKRQVMGTAYNSVFQGVAKVSGSEDGANNWIWDLDAGTPSAAYTLEDPRLADVANGDLRLGHVSPCIDAIEKPTAENYGADYWKTATTDINGNRLRVGANGELTPGAYQTEFPEVYMGKLYVDPVNGKDTNDGWQRTRALKTIAAAFASKWCTSGTTVYLEPAVYDASNTPAVTSEEGGMLDRIFVPEGIALVSLGSATNTFIIGAKATDTTLPTRCVQLHKNSSIRGFTLTGGDTDADENGGGVYVRSADSAGACVYDCIITNNTSAKRGGGASSVSLLRCYLAGNSNSDGVGVATIGCSLFNCVVDSQARSGSRCYSSYPRNCTFLPSRRADETQEAVNFSGKQDVSYCKNSIFLCQTRHDAVYTSCLIATNAIDVGSRKYDPAILGDTVQLVTLKEAKVRKDGSLRRSSPAVDTGDDALYNLEAWGDKDFKGNDRILGASIDLGAIEYDPSQANKSFLIILR